MTPEEQQYQWMRNQTALRTLGLQPSDLMKYVTQSSLSNSPLDGTELWNGKHSPYTARKELRSNAPDSMFQQAGDYHSVQEQKKTEQQLILGQALMKMFLGSNQPTQPVAPYRATPPTLR